MQPSLIDQIRDGLKAFIQQYEALTGRMLPYVEATLIVHPDLHTRLRYAIDDEQMADWERRPLHVGDVQIPPPSPLPDLPASFYGLTIQRSPVQPVNTVTFAYEGLRMDVQVTTTDNEPTSPAPQIKLAVFVMQQSIGSWDRSFGGFYHRWGSPNVFSSVEKAVEFLRWNYTEYSDWHAPVPDPVQDEGAPDDWWIELQVPEPGFMSAQAGEDPTKALIRIQRQFVDGLMEQIRREE